MPDTRLNRLLEMIQQNGLDAAAINPGPSLVYLTGLHFHLMERPTILIVAPGKKPALVLPALEMGKTAGLEAQFTPFPFNDTPATWPGVVEQACRSLGLSNQTIGVEPNRFRFLELSLMQTALPQAHFTGAELVFNSLRLQKDAQEVDQMREAVRIAQVGFKKTLPSIKVGVTEREIAAELLLQMLRAGSDTDMPFAPIIASGPNSANPHAVPTDRKIQPGDLIVVDWGASYQGYFSDITRTVAIGPVEPEYKHIAEVVKNANQAGCATARPGIAAGQVDRATRAVIDQAGYGVYFTHRTGHGLGMEEHEPPYIYGENQLTLLPGMTFTVEPGIYLSGRAGVRIEDDVVVTESGAEALSDLPRELYML